MSLYQWISYLFFLCLCHILCPLLQIHMMRVAPLLFDVEGGLELDEDWAAVSGSRPRTQMSEFL